MAAKWVGFIIFVWVIGSIVGLMAEGITVSGNETTVLNQVMFWQQVRSDETWTPVTVVATPINFLTGLFRLLTFDFCFFEGQWEYVRYIILSPIIGTIVMGMIITFFGIFSRTV